MRAWENCPEILLFAPYKIGMMLLIETPLTEQQEKDIGL